MIAFEPIVKPLLFVHLVAAVCGIAVSIHVAVRSWKAFVQPSELFIRNARLHALILFVSYGVAYGVGALIYPTF